MGAMAAAVTGLLGSMAGAGINAAVTSASNQDQYRYSKKLMQYQDELNASRWQEQFNTITGYNSPKNQLQLKEEAGINPLFSDGDYGTSISPGAQTSLGGYSPKIPELGLGPSFQNFAQQLLAQKSLQLDERRVKAIEEKTDSDIKNNTQQTLSECAVNLQSIQNMQKQNDKTDKDIDKINTDIVAVKQSILQNWEKLRQGNESIAQDWAKLGIQDYTSKWQEQVAKENNSIGWYDARTKRENFDLANRTLNFEIDKFDKTYRLDVKKWSAELRKGNIQSFNDVVKNMTNNVFGFKYVSSKDIANLSALMQSFVNNMDSMSNDDFLKIAPGAVNAMHKFSDLNRWKAPWSNMKSIQSSKSGSYPYQPKDVSDGW